MFINIYGRIARVHHCTWIMLIMLIILVLHTPVSAAERTLNLTKVKSSELESIGSIFKLRTDALGLLWIAGANGLARYNGYDVELFQHSEDDDYSISTNSITDLLIARDGRLWIATYWGLNVYDATTGHFIKYLHDPASNSPSSNAILCITEDNSGNIWLGTNGSGLDHLDTKTNKFTHFSKKNGLSGETIKSLHADSHGYLWLGYDQHGLDYFPTNLLPTQQTVTNISPIQNPSAHVLVDDIAEDAQGNIWTTGSNGINQISRANFQLVSYSGDDPNPRGFKALGSNRVFFDSKNKLWATGTDKYIYRYEPDKDEFVGFSTGEVSTITAINEDNSGGLWLGFEKTGIAKIDRYANSFTVLRNNPHDINSLNSSNIQALAIYSDQEILIGTDEGLNILNTNDYSIKRFDPQNELHGKGVDALAVIGQDIWIGNSWWGAKRCTLVNGCFKNYASNKETHTGLVNSEIWSMLIDSQQHLWVGAHRGWLHVYQPNSDSFSAIEVHPGHVVGRILSMLEDHQGDLWLGADNGLFHRINGSEDFIYYDDKHPNIIVPKFQTFFSIFEDSKSNIWFGSGGGGAYYWDRKNNTFLNITKEEGLAHNRVSGITEDSTGNIWFSTNGGISRYSPQSKTFRNYTTAHGIAGNYHDRSTALKLPSGQLAFGSTTGLTIVDPLNVFENNSKPPVVITSIRVLNQPVYSGQIPKYSKKPLFIADIVRIKEFTLNHKQSVFSIYFSLLNYEIPQSNKYTYKLEGFDKDWIYSDTNRSATYTNLDPGQYRFKVKAANNEGIWSDKEASIDIIILPPWWRTWWAYLIYAAALTLSIYNAIQAQIRKRKNAENLARALEERVIERTQEIREKTANIHSMLNNMQLGLFSIQSDITIHPNYSSFLEDIYETKKISGEDAIDFLFKKSKLDRDIIDQIRHAIFSILGSDTTNYDLNSHILLNRYEITTRVGESKFLDLAWNPIFENEVITQIMVTVRDVTEIIALENEADEQKREVQTIQILLNLKENTFIRYYKSSILYLEDGKNLIINDQISLQEKIDILFRNIHTIKGNSRTLGFLDISSAAHEAESLYAKARTNPEQLDIELAKNHLEKITNKLHKHKLIFDKIFNNKNTVSNGDELLFSKTELLESIPNLNKNPAFTNLVMHKESISLIELLSPLFNSLSSIATSLGKPNPEVIAQLQGIRIREEARTLINDIFTHLLRNCLDHGIEEADIRQKYGKKPFGSIYITPEISCKRKELYIFVSDDGQGLNLSFLRSKSIAENHWGHTPTDDEIAVSIFNAGVSSKSNVTEISGRGMGLNIVQNYLKVKNCQIKLVLGPPNKNMDGYRIFKILIIIPQSLYFLDEDNLSSNKNF